MKCARKKRADFICPYRKLSDQVGAHEMRPKKRADFICPYGKLSEREGFSILPLRRLILRDDDGLVTELEFALKSPIGLGNAVN